MSDVVGVFFCDGYNEQNEIRFCGSMLSVWHVKCTKDLSASPTIRHFRDEMTAPAELDLRCLNLASCSLV